MNIRNINREIEFQVEPFNVDDPGTGYKLDDRPDVEWEECAQWGKVYAAREYDTRLNRKSLTPLRTQWIEDADLVDVERV